ncbi:Arc-like DNA binding domain [Pseudomonas luteola]|uniref:Arc-like DNA binding domain n=1 Tax=Pseudomonas luteola TaxID=47886 RepID=A0A2X2CR79_PSELU|nr:Arc family DNA-binding protein [Pseudomonas luteola]SPZ02525.1 Arc-like DNA binding domain [Pseudomonas luteola]
MTWRYPLRLPLDMREPLACSAKNAKRSINAEIVYRLQQTEALQGEIAALKAILAELTGPVHEVVK